MPRPPTDVFWKTHVVRLAIDPNSGRRRPVKQIYELLQQTAERLNRDDFPSERTVRRLVQKQGARDAQAQRADHPFHWPTAMIDGDIPWEASRACLDLLAYCAQHKLTRPTTREALWFYRLSLAGPCMPPDEMQAAALALATQDIARSIGQPVADDFSGWHELEHVLSGSGPWFEPPPAPMTPERRKQLLEFSES